MADEHLRGGVVFAAAAGVEEGRFGGSGDPAAEAEIGEGDDGRRVGLPVCSCGRGGEGRGRDVDKDIWVACALAMIFMEKQPLSLVRFGKHTFELDVTVYNVLRVQIPYSRDQFREHAADQARG